jgi:hypothetical protein
MSDTTTRIIQQAIYEKLKELQPNLVTEIYFLMRHSDNKNPSGVEKYMRHNYRLNPHWADFAYHAACHIRNATKNPVVHFKANKQGGE